MSVGDFLDSTNSWIVGHKELLTVFAVPTLAWLVTYMANLSAEKRIREERQIERGLQQALKVADFRKEWIEALRSEFVDILALAYAKPPVPREQLDKMDQTLNRVLLLINHEDEHFEGFTNSLTSYFNSLKRGEGVNHAALVQEMQNILRTEWRKLKREISGAEVE